MTCGLFVCGFYENPSSSLFSKAVWGEKAAYSQQEKKHLYPTCAARTYFYIAVVLLYLCTVGKNGQI